MRSVSLNGMDVVPVHYGVSVLYVSLYEEWQVRVERHK